MRDTENTTPKAAGQAWHTPTDDERAKCKLNPDAPLNMETATHKGRRIFVYQLSDKYLHRLNPNHWHFIVAGECGGGPYPTKQQAQAAAIKAAN